MSKVRQNLNGQASNGEISVGNEQARIAELLEASVRLQMVPILERELEDPKMRALFEETGSKKTAEIAKKLKMSSATICSTWKRWADLGLLVKDGKAYRKVV